MKKKYFYEFSGTISLKADNQSQAENAVTGKVLNDYLIDERVFEVDENYVPYDIMIRKDKFGTYLHPIDDGKNYDEFRKRECKYGNIINDFLHGKFDKNELMKRMAEAEEENLDDCYLFSEISMIDLEGKKFKRVRHVNVD